jgi:hypothetical protein
MNLDLTDPLFLLEVQKQLEQEVADGYLEHHECAYRLTDKGRSRKRDETEGQSDAN